MNREKKRYTIRFFDFLVHLLGNLQEEGTILLVVGSRVALILLMEAI